MPGVPPGLLPSPSSERALSLPSLNMCHWNGSPRGQALVSISFTVALPEPRTVPAPRQAHNSHRLDGKMTFVEEKLRHKEVTNHDQGHSHRVAELRLNHCFFHALYQGPAHFFYKGTENKYFRLCKSLGCLRHNYPTVLGQHVSSTDKTKGMAMTVSQKQAHSL